MSETRLDPNELAVLVSDAVAMELEQFELRRAEYDLTPERSAILAQISVGYAALCKDNLMSNDFVSIEPLMYEVLHQHGLPIDPDSRAWRELGRAMLRGLSQGYIRDAMRCLGEYEEDAQGSMPLPAVWQAFGTPATEGVLATAPTGQTTLMTRATPLTPVTPTEAVAGDNAPTLKTFVADWFAEKAKSKWKKQTESQNKNSINILFLCIKDQPLHRYTRPQIETLRNTLERLPSNYGKSSRHKKMSLEQVIAEKDDETLTMARKTLNRHWGSITAFLRWANTQQPTGLPAVDLGKLFDELSWSADVPDSEDRIQWDDDSLAKLFASPIWTGFVEYPDKGYWRHNPDPGGLVIRDEYWWLPVLAILHGGRLEEYCCLTGDDVYEIDGIPVLDINKGLKTKSSRRIVPVHSIAIRCGFLDLVKQAKGERLFPAMERSGRDKKYGHIYSERFTDYRRRIGVYVVLMDYHSFRKNTTSKIVSSGIPNGLLMADEITGHDSKNRKEIAAFNSISLDYLAPSELKRRKAAIETVIYPSIDWTPLLAEGFSSTTGKERGAEIRRILAEGRQRKGRRRAG